MRHHLRAKRQIQDKRIPLNIDTYTDANWASRERTRKSTTGFVTHVFGAAIHYGSRTQTGSNGLLGIYMQFNCHSVYIWSCNACVNMTQLATEPAVSRRHATTAQALSIMDVNNIKLIPEKHRTTLARHISTQEISVIDTQGTLAGAAIPGQRVHQGATESLLCSLRGDQEQGVLGIHDWRTVGQDAPHTVRYMCHFSVHRISRYK